MTFRKGLIETIKNQPNFKFSRFYLHRCLVELCNIYLLPHHSNLIPHLNSSHPFSFIFPLPIFPQRIGKIFQNCRKITEGCPEGVRLYAEWCLEVIMGDFIILSTYNLVPCECLVTERTTPIAIIFVTSDVPP